MGECVFCDIASGKKDALILYSDEFIISIMDHRPINNGHVLVMPKRHYRDIFEVPADILCKATEVARRVSIAINSTYHPMGLNIIENNGTDAGQTVFHFHIHLIPRYDSKYNTELAKVAWHRKVISPEELKMTRDEILKNMNIP